MHSAVSSQSDAIYARLQVTPPQLADFCQAWQIAELAVFGSVLRDDFRSKGQDRSDIDVLFTYAAQARRNLLRQIRMQFELEDLLQRPVDLVSKTAVLADPNRYRRESILSQNYLCRVIRRQFLIALSRFVKFKLIQPVLALLTS